MPLYITLLYLFCGTITTVIGVLSLLKNPQSSAHRSYFFFTMSVLVWLICMYFGYYLGNVTQWYEGSLALIRGAYAASFFLGLGLCGFFHYFPRPALSIPGWLITAIIAITAALSGIALFTPLIEKALIFQDGYLYGDEFGPWYSVYVWYFLGSLLVAVLLGIHKIWITQGLERKKIMVAAFACWVFLFFGVMTNVVLPLWGIFLLQMESPAFSLFFIIPAFYAMQRYRFFNVSYASLKIIRWLLLFAVLVAVIFGVSFILKTLGTTAPLSPEIITIVSAVVGLLVIKKLETIVPELLPKNFRELRSRLQELQGQIYYCQNYRELLEHLEKTFVVDLGFSSVKLLLVRDKVGESSIPVYIRDELIETLTQQSNKVLVSSELKAGNKEQKHLGKLLEQRETSLCFPLTLEQRIIGLLLLGKGENDEYAREELDELLNIRMLVELCFINILLQSDLKEENDLMKKVIREKTKSLRQQNEKINNLLRQQSDFIAVTAHEFRTPLNIALLQLEDTLESYEHSHQVLDDMKVLEASLERLKYLTQDLFDVQQYDLQKAPLHLEKADMLTFLRTLAIECDELMARHQIAFEFESSVKDALWMSFDPAKMRQVLHNLLTNAQKFSPPESTVSLRLDSNAEAACISVIDHGRGIPDEDKERVFEKFQTAKVNLGMGIGLGLYICKKIVELHGGTIAIADTPGGGATFIVTLPLNAAESTDAAEATNENA